MRDELDKLLCERYPKIFVNRRAPMTETAMCFGFEHSDGWFNILNQLCRNIQQHIDSINYHRERLLQNNPHNQPIPDEIEQVVAEQVKEKFGSLRFYYQGGDEYIYGLVNMAESMSGVTCEECGSPGTVSEGGWAVTLCEKHHEERGFGK